MVTDSLGMEGVRTKYGDDRVPVLALKAGVDQLLNPPDLDLAWNAVLTAVREGELTEARLDQSILRVLRLKAKLGLFRSPYVSQGGVDRTVGIRTHLKAADRMAERTTTLLVNEGGLLPLSRRRHPKVLVVGADPASPSGTTGPPTGVLAGALSELGFTATALSTGTAPSAATIAKAVAAARDADAVVAATYNVTAGSSQKTLVEQLVGDRETGRGGRDPQSLRRGPTAVRPGLPGRLLLDGRRTAGRRTGDRGPCEAAREAAGRRTAGG
ncbi:hypothetical protein GCM10011428_68930 [Streptomyces violaceus]